MAFYTNSVATRLIDPQFHQSKRRDEFRITEEGLWGSNLRIHNLGVLVDGASFTAGRTYNKLTGSHGVINNMYLYDGNEVLDKVVDFKDFGGFVEYNNSNSVNSDLNKVVSRTGLGFVYDADVVSPAGVLTLPTIKEFNASNGGHILNTSPTNSPSGYLDLRLVFPLLQQLQFLHTGLFKNLRVVIEYALNDALTANVNGNITDTLRPVLAIDQFLDEKFAAKWLGEFKQVVWNAIELESVQAPAITAKTTNSYNLKGFSNKTLQSLLLQKKGSATVSSFYNSNGSETQFGEEIQVSVDGSELLPDGGVKHANHRLALLNDTFGNCNAHPCSANLSMYGASTSIANYADRVGHLDYFGMKIGKKVGTLEVKFTRDVANAPANNYAQALTLNFFGFVSKAILKTKDGYQIIYV